MCAMRIRILLVGALALVACKKEEKPSTPSGAAASAAAPPSLPPLGVADPWPKSSPEVRKAFADYHKATRAKKYDEARAALDRVLQLAPDSVSARLLQFSTVQ